MAYYGIAESHVSLCLQHQASGGPSSRVWLARCLEPAMHSTSLSSLDTIGHKRSSYTWEGYQLAYVLHIRHVSICCQKNENPQFYAPCILVSPGVEAMGTGSTDTYIMLCSPQYFFHLKSVDSRWSFHLLTARVSKDNGKTLDT